MITKERAAKGIYICLAREAPRCVLHGVGQLGGRMWLKWTPGEPFHNAEWLHEVPESGGDRK